MTKTMALPAIALALVSACAGSSEDDSLKLEEDGGKTDVVRPFGTWERTLAQDEAGFTYLDLREDKTYGASQELVRCEIGECTDEFGGTFRFASSNGKPYIVLYNDGDWWYSFEYKMATDSLSLRHTGTSRWFTMTRDTGRLELGESDDGGTFTVQEGDDVVLSLPANPSTGYSWVVTATDRSFGYPEETFEADSGATGSGGTSTFTWKTSGPFNLIGPHTVKLEYKRPWDTTNPPEDTFTFTVDIWAPGP
jgi:inhibitor of cysteine peptidase